MFDLADQVEDVPFQRPDGSHVGLSEVYAGPMVLVFMRHQPMAMTTRRTVWRGIAGGLREQKPSRAV
jgi:hypothetical protein